MKKHFGKLYTPLAWTILIELLLCLPGKVLPGSESFDIPHFDKIVHVIFFGVFVGLWCLYFSKKPLTHQQLKIAFFCVYLAASVNGIVIEYIQFYFIPNRSFDQGDIIADILSAGIIYGLSNVKLLSSEWKSFHRT